MVEVYIYGIPLLLIMLVYFLRQYLVHRKALLKLQETLGSGRTEPASLHPVIDETLCLGCGTCVTACPEGEILGLVNRKARLVSPSSCIGHGACRTACPTGAITLVFGTATRGVEIPNLSPAFETSVKGIYIAGELGGMGLIRNAINQGRQAVEAIAQSLSGTSALPLDLVIVGAGPAGLSAALTAKDRNLRFVVLEQDQIGGTVSHYPRGKIVMTEPAILPIIGKFQFREASKEKLVEFWHKVTDTVDLNIRTGRQVDTIVPKDGGFHVTAGSDDYIATAVLLAMGRRGTPRKLGVPGEELDKVTYKMIDPEQYAQRKVLVVGGGDSAIEAAVAIAEQPGTEVILSYRGAAFSRAKKRNLDNVEAAADAGRLTVMLESTLQHISADSVLIDWQGQLQTHANDDVIVCAGGVLPTPFLRKTGISVEEKYGTA